MADKTSSYAGQRRFAMLMGIPALIVLLILVAPILFYILKNSFYDITLTVPRPPEFVGGANYAAVFKDTRFLNALKNTGILLVLGISIQSILGLIIALLLNRDFRFKRLAITLLAIPIMITPVVAGFNWRMIYNEHFGPLNFILNALHISEGISWTADPSVALYSILIVDIWQWTPFVALILLAGLQSIPKQVYEASNVDGATPVQTFFRVTLPLLKPMFILVILFRTIWIFKIFDPVYILTGGGPGTSTETLSVYTYVEGFRYWRIGYTSALAVVQLMMMTVVASVFVRLMKRKG